MVGLRGIELINQLLLLLNVFEQVQRLGQSNVIWENLAVSCVKIAKFGEPAPGFSFGVASFEEFIDIVVNQVVLEQSNNLSAFVVDQVIDYLQLSVSLLLIFGGVEQR